MSHKVVLITGSSSGFGLLTALQFARNGDSVYASLRNTKSNGALQLKKIAQKEKLHLEVVELDVSEDKSVHKAVENILKKEGQIDILINNAGVGFYGPVEDFSIEEVQQQYNINVLGMLRTVKEVVPGMRERKSGLIINLSSINGLIAFPLMGIYCSSKHAVEALTGSLRFELSHFGIKVTQVEPGSFMTDFLTRVKQPKKPSAYESFTSRFFSTYFATHKKAEKSTFLQKLLNPQKVADLIYEIAKEESPQSHYLIGIDAHIYYYAKKLLPEQLWEYILHKTYKW
jgi:NAD(P)-dependent dehydrogenase (short-subunit alcohol dehydrogenase family)